MVGVGEGWVTVLTPFLHSSCPFPDFSIPSLSAGQSVGPAGAVTKFWAILKKGGCISLLGLS